VALQKKWSFGGNMRRREFISAFGATAMGRPMPRARADEVAG
jgi:hypothetical protein